MPSARQARTWDITLTRTGNTTSSASVTFATNDAAGLTNCNVFNGTASPRCDYENTIGTATWAPATLRQRLSPVAIVDDSYAEVQRNLHHRFNSPSGATSGVRVIYNGNRESLGVASPAAQVAVPMVFS